MKRLFHDLLWLLCFYTWVCVFGVMAMQHCKRIQAVEPPPETMFAGFFAGDF